MLESYSLHLVHGINAFQNTQRKSVGIVSFEVFNLRSCPYGQARCQSCGFYSEVLMVARE